jgi:hypothetical protein
MTGFFDADFADYTDFLTQLIEERNKSLGKARDLRYTPACAFD